MGQKDTHNFQMSFAPPLLERIQHLCKLMSQLLLTSIVNAKQGTSLVKVVDAPYHKHLNKIKVTCHNFDDLVRQCYWVWGDMTSINVKEISFALFSYPS